MILEVTEINDNTIEQIDELMHQLSPKKNKKITKDYLNTLISEPNIKIFVEFDENQIITGIITVVIIKLLSGVKARIEDLVVLKKKRGKGIGKNLIKYSIIYCKKKNIQFIDLTSHPDKIEANNLYLKLEFKKGDTNVYRKYL